jgi:hypothetical protein
MRYALNQNQNGVNMGIFSVPMRDTMMSQEYRKFDQTMTTILRADPKTVKAAMEAEKQERQMEASRTGKRGRGRPPKTSASSRVPSEKD